MNKKFLIIAFLLFFCCCDSNDDNMKSDVAAFDKFIGIPVSEIRQVLGQPTDYTYTLYDSDLQDFTYMKQYVTRNSNQEGCGCGVTIRTSTQELTIFSYYKTVTFIVKGTMCIDWRAK